MKRMELDTDIFMQYWNDFMSIQEIADAFSCSTSVVRKKLKSLDIPCDRSTMMSRHYAKIHADKWSDIKSSFDSGMSMFAVSKQYNVSIESLHMLCERYDYEYSYDKKNPDIVSDEYKSQLIELLRDHTVKEIAEIFGKSEKTISRHMSYFGLTQSAARTDISDDDVLADWNSGMSVMDIAQKYHCAHDTITKRLKKYNISFTRKSGIERHFARVHGQKWDDIVVDLDACMSISDVAQKYNMRYECVYRLMEQHGYKYRGFEDIDLDSLNALIEKSDDDRAYYLSVIRDYYMKYHNRPVQYTFAQYLGLSVSDAKHILVKYDLFSFLGTSGPSVKVMRILHDLDDLQIKYELNNRTLLRQDSGNFMEIDIYLPDFNLGIEVNPTWTHSIDTMSYGQEDKCYHQKKSLLAEKCGVGLVHLYDNDFLDNRKYNVLLIQLKAMQCAKKRCGARQCNIKLIDREVSNAFLNQYHFQGGEIASFKQYGMYLHDVLVGVFTVGFSRYTKNQFEIIRYCMNPAYIVHGCFDKFLHHFLCDIGKSCSIVSYMDLNKRLIPSNVYEKHGFMFDGITTPDYVWINQSGSDWKSRYACMKQNLIKQGFDAAKTEVEIMREQNYCRVFGAGSKRYILNYKG